MACNVLEELRKQINNVQPALDFHKGILSWQIWIENHFIAIAYS